MTNSPADDNIRAQDDGLTIVDRLLADMVSSGEFLSDACNALGIHRMSVYAKLRKDEAFAQLMDEARDAGADARAARTAQIARGNKEAGSSGDWKRDQLICKQENWLLEKWHPKRYGAKIEIETKNRTLSAPMSSDPIEAARQYADMIRGD